MIKTTTRTKPSSKKLKPEKAELEPKASTIELLLNYSKSLIVLKNNQIGKFAQVLN